MPNVGKAGTVGTAKNDEGETNGRAVQVGCREGGRQCWGIFAFENTVGSKSCKEVTGRMHHKGPEMIRTERVDGPPREREQQYDLCIHLLHRFLHLISESCPPPFNDNIVFRWRRTRNCRPCILQPQVHALDASDFSRSMGQATRYLSRSRANIRRSCTTVVAVTASDSNEAPGRGVDTFIDSDRING